MDDWRPFTNIEQAFMLVEKMRERRYTVVLVAGKNKPEWSCELAKETFDIGRTIEFATTPSEAICNAIIKTLEAK